MPRHAVLPRVNSPCKIVISYGTSISLLAKFEAFLPMESMHEYIRVQEMRSL